MTLVTLVTLETLVTLVSLDTRDSTCPLQGEGVTEGRGRPEEGVGRDRGVEVCNIF